MLESLLPYLVPLAVGWAMRHAGFLSHLNVPLIGPAAPAAPAAPTGGSVFQELEAELAAALKAQVLAAAKNALAGLQQPPPAAPAKGA